MSSHHGSNRLPEDGPTTSACLEARTSIDMLLSRGDPVDWNAVAVLLRSLAKRSAAMTRQARYQSNEEDPLGRLLLSKLLSRTPPMAVIKQALEAFPDAPRHNPAAFFTACSGATPEIVGMLTRHITKDFQDDQDECPFPWIVSEHISVEGAQAILEAFPRGVLKSSSFLCGYNPLDFFLQSDCMIDQRTFDHKLWSKFKLILMATQGAEQASCGGVCEISPVHVILRRVMARSDFWTNSKQTQHVLWLLHQLRWTDHWVFEKQSRTGSYAIHEVLSHKCTSDPAGLVAARALVQLLLEAHPASAKHWLANKLPLHLAVENGWPCHDLLLAVYPESLNARVPSTELLPFQTAANGHDYAGPSLSLDVTFELLRANPVHARRWDKDGQSVGAQA